jgi:hypothetical protein
MGTQPKPEESQGESVAARFVLRLPGFIMDEPVGVGDIIKRATAAIGIQPCNSCNQRARALNRFVAVSSTRRP